MTSVERAFPALLQEFFHRRLIAQRDASAHTIASYRDTFTLFLGYAAERTRSRREEPDDGRTLDAVDALAA